MGRGSVAFIVLFLVLPLVLLGGAILVPGWDMVFTLLGLALLVIGLTFGMAFVEES